MRPSRRWAVIALLALLLLGSTPAPTAARARAAASPEDCARDVLARLSPEERVGQLFLVAFQGSAIAPESPIYDLVTHYHVGGVVLLRENDNIPGGEDAAAALQEEISALQRAAWRVSLQATEDPNTHQTIYPPYVPLLVATVQDGDGFPGDQILQGMTPLPSPMAVGATWQPELAQAVGEVLGREMAALGINLLLGPPLDVAVTPHPGSPGDLGIDTFGGDPYWVGRMGQAYIQGVHQGSSGQVGVVVKHFPGYSGSDRSPAEEVATVRKSLEQLKQIELAPFFAVTGSAPDPAMVADGLLVSHIRYQGFQGNIRATTRPVSLDPQAFAQLMGLQTFAAWRENGGVTVSDDLGSRAIRRFYDPNEAHFDAFLVARDALLAGNDLLYLGAGFHDPNDPDQYTTVVNTLNFFAQKYRTDPAFAQRVDAAALRVLTLKCRLFGRFAYATVRPRPDALAVLGQGVDVVFQVAQQAATLISPAPTDLESVLPAPPQPRERILLLADTLAYRQCATCPEVQALSPEAFQEALLRLYGPTAGNQVRPQDFLTLTFAELQAWLDDPQAHPDVASRLKQADWVVVGLLDVSPDRKNSGAFRRLLDQQPGMLRDKRVVVFAFNAPYYLDATDISKLSAYYGLYGKAAPFVEAAARLLFRELAPQGALPVSVPGVGYDLIDATAPNPDQVIPLLWDFPLPQDAAEATSPSLTEPLRVTPDQSVPVRTGVILDHNGHPVPDGTVVRFMLTSPGGDQVQQSVEVTTVGGVARASFQATQPGLWEIRAQSEPARQSQVLAVEVPGEPESGTAPPPTVVVTLIAPTPTAAPVESTLTPDRHDRLDGADYLLALLTALLTGWGAYRLGLQQGRVRWGLRWGLLAFIGGMSVYALMAARRVWTAALLARWGYAAGPLAALVGAGAGLVLGAAWFAWAQWQASARGG